MKRLIGLLLIGLSLSAFWSFLYAQGGWTAILLTLGMFVALIVVLIGIKLASEK